MNTPPADIIAPIVNIILDGNLLNNFPIVGENNAYRVICSI